MLELAELEEGQALVRFACALALHAFEVATRARAWAVRSGAGGAVRACAVDAGRGVLAVGDQSDAELARRFGVPIEQIPIRRRELGSRVNGVDSCP
jgi:hypothetical protein